jgi:molecular chaperone HtpG
MTIESTLQQRLAQRIPEAEAPALDQIVVGKDILELLSSAMYVDPMTIYREYIQNAADAIDLAHARGILGDEPGRVDITLIPTGRTVRIRDNGVGLAAKDFARTLLSLGASGKRGSSLRGFRGIGRLAGLAYAQELTFRSRAAGESHVSELRWDCRKLKAALRGDQFDCDVTALIQHVVSISQASGDDLPERFFEVELKGVVRLRADRLMTRTTVERHLSQHAPVPFAPEFTHGAEIAAALSAAGVSTGLRVHIDGADTPLYRPHRDSFDAGNGRQIGFEELEIRELPDMDGGLAAIVWVLHHAYEGAIPQANLVKGLRMRAGDVQVGGDHTLEELFPEQRFNSWSVGEVHVLDRRVVPNGRRDDFEQNVHHNNLLNHMTPLVRDISKRCRTNSIRRNWIRKFDVSLEQAQAIADSLNAPGTGEGRRGALIGEAHEVLNEATRIAAMPLFREEGSSSLQDRIMEARNFLGEAEAEPQASSDPLAAVPYAERAVVELMITLIQECSSDQRAANKLVRRIIERLVAEA